MKDHVFMILQGGIEVWQAVLDGEVIKATWLDRGSAHAGLDVERRRKLIAKSRQPLLENKEIEKI